MSRGLGQGRFLDWLLVFAALLSIAHSQSVPANSSPVASSLSTAPSYQVSLRHPGDPRAKVFYRLIWGVDSLRVKTAESGELIRFSYTVLDADKAQQLNDKRATPYLIDERAHVSLVVPSLEKVGQLRQSSPPEAGKAYWMAFSNKGLVVKSGDQVSVVIGKFRVDGLIVQ
jgi:hypothetical protein